MSDLATAYRTHTCGELRLSHVSKNPVTLAGWVDTRVDKRTFLLRDRYGKTLVRAAEDTHAYVPERFEKLGPEDVVKVSGEVAPRAVPDPDHPTGAIYLEATAIEVLTLASPPPQEILRAAEVAFEDRLAFRNLYLRRPDVQKRLGFRSRVAHEIREFLVSKGFLEIETPHLFWYDKVAIAPEPVPVGAGKAFALPSGSVVLDQYLKPGQFDRFFQFLRVTRRDLHPTPLHQMEHTVLDINLAYVDEPDFCDMIEQLMVHVWRAALGVELKTPFKRYSYEEAIVRFGSERPDARIGLEIVDLPEVAREGGFARAFRVPGGAPRLTDEDLEAAAAEARGGGRVRWLKIGSEKRLDGTAVALFTETGFHDTGPYRQSLLKKLEAGAGDAVLVSTAPDQDAAALTAGDARLRIARKLKLGQGSPPEPVWVHSYPYLARDERGDYVPNVVVFARPKDEDIPGALMPEKRNAIRARAFDLVVDGMEIASAYIGHHNLLEARFIWEGLFLMSVPDLVRLRAPVESHRFGVPPHGGMNLGFERLIAAMLGLQAIDEVMAFPKTHDCRDLFVGAPGSVPPEAVQDLVAEAPPPTYTESDLAEEVTKA